MKASVLVSALVLVVVAIVAPLAGSSHIELGRAFAGVSPDHEIFFYARLPRVILALLAGGDTRSESLHNGVDYLVRTQRTDGAWDEEYCTGTGFPRVFYLEYTDYRNTFPLLALSAYRKAMTKGDPNKRFEGSRVGNAERELLHARHAVASYARSFETSPSSISTPAFPPLSNSASSL